jgi:hypothetical protein
MCETFSLTPQPFELRHAIVVAGDRLAVDQTRPLSEFTASTISG